MKIGTVVKQLGGDIGLIKTLNWYFNFIYLNFLFKNEMELKIKK